MAAMTETVEERLRRFLETRAEPDLNSGCWLWSGNMQPAGYGVIWDRKDGRKRNIFAHRASWRINVGEIPDGMVVCHRCDTPACVNPAHLFLGTQRDNLRDMFAKGRHQRHGQKLTPKQVVAIRNDARPCSAVAADYGVGRSTVSRVRRKEVYVRTAHTA